MPYQAKRTPIGSRRERIALQAKVSSTDDGMGGQVSTWKTVAKPWANITPLDGRSIEALRASQVTASHFYHVDLRYRTATVPNVTMRIAWRKILLQIHSVVDDDVLQRRLVLHCGEIQSS